MDPPEGKILKYLNTTIKLTKFVLNLKKSSMFLNRVFGLSELYPTTH